MENREPVTAMGGDRLRFVLTQIRRIRLAVNKTIIENISY